MIVKDIYSKNVFRCSQDQTLSGAIGLMMDNDTNTLVVCDDDGRFLGMITSRDILLAAIPHFIDKQTAPFIDQHTFNTILLMAKDTPVKNVMNKKVPKLTLETPVIRVAASVLTQNESRLPVVDFDGIVIGVVTRTQIKNAVAKVLNLL